MIDLILVIYFCFASASVASFAMLSYDRRGILFANGKTAYLKSICKTPSRCDSCGSQITGLGLLPVFGYMFNLGKCSHCESTIPFKLFLVEAVFALFPALLYFTLVSP